MAKGPRRPPEHTPLCGCSPGHRRSKKGSALAGGEALSCLMLARNSSESQRVSKLDPGMLKRCQAERMALAALPSSRNQTAGKKKLFFSTELFPAAVKNYHSLDHRQKAPAEVFKRRWSDLFTQRSFPLPTRCRPLAALGWLSLSHGTTGVGMTVGPARAPLSLLSVAGGLTARRSPSSAPPSCPLGSALFAAVPLFSPSSSDGGLKSQQRSAADCHTSCSSSAANSAAGVGKAVPGARGSPGDVPELGWQGTACSGRATEHPGGCCCSRERGSLSPSQGQCLQQAAGTPPATLAGDLGHSELLPRLGRSPRLRWDEDGERAPPCGEESLSLLPLSQAKGSSLGTNAIPAPVFQRGG